MKKEKDVGGNLRQSFAAKLEKFGHRVLESNRLLQTSVLEKLGVWALRMSRKLDIDKQRLESDRELVENHVRSLCIHEAARLLPSDKRDLSEGVRSKIEEISAEYKRLCEAGIFGIEAGVATVVRVVEEELAQDRDTLIKLVRDVPAPFEELQNHANFIFEVSLTRALNRLRKWH